MGKEFRKLEGESSRWVYITDEHGNAITLSAMERWKIGRFKRTIKELSQLDNGKPEELESEFDHFDLNNWYPSSPFKGIVDLDFLQDHIILNIYQRERFIGLTSILYLSLQN